jgi:putative transferase (TIGR04331 family)
LSWTPVDHATRRKLQGGVAPGLGFEHFVRLLLWETLPVCYVEGYQALIEKVQELGLPKAPQFIFTSNNFDTDEVFKAWIAQAVERGTPYFAGQHGNHYGTHIESGKWPEQETCDRFFTWGWVNDCEKDVPAFVFKLAGQKRDTNPGGGLLLVEVCQPHRFGVDDSYSQFGNYLEEQFRFVAALPAAIRERLTVRLHSAYRHFYWHEDQRWNSFDPNVKVDVGTTPIDELIGQSRLVVHSYDSTGILEALALNLPTMCFWQGGLEHLLPSAKPYYELLRDVGILADSPEQMAMHVASCWDAPEIWWQSEKVQYARRVFCERYARNVSCPVTQLKNLFTTHAKRYADRQGSAE